VVIHEPVLEISCGQKQCAHTDRQTDTRRWPQDLAAYGAQVITRTDRYRDVCTFYSVCRNLNRSVHALCIVFSYLNVFFITKQSSLWYDSFTALILLIGQWKGIRHVKKTGVLVVVIWLELGANDLHVSEFWLPYAGSGVVIDPLHFLARCHTRFCLSCLLAYIFECLLCCRLEPLFALLFVCSISWFWLGCQYQCKWLTWKASSPKWPIVCWWER